MNTFSTLAAPLLEQPVLILESDDWGPAPEEHAEALHGLRKLLTRHRDPTGHPAVMTLGVVLSIPHMEKILDTGEYAARTLNEPQFAAVLEAMKKGAAEGAFHIQLHGMAHYWPDNLMAEIGRNPEVRRQLLEEPWHTERLPSWLQSRWIDGRRLPSTPLEATQIQQAVQEEVALFESCFGRPPSVVVPPTFVWDDSVERAYAEAGLTMLVTPGRRFTGRDEGGRLLPEDRIEINGRRRAEKLTTLVRDIYFEPALGHAPAAAVKQIQRKWRLREPALLETHRFNFLGENKESAFAAVEQLLSEAKRKIPGLLFRPPQDAAGLLQRNPLVLLHTPSLLWRRLRPHAI